MDRETPPPQERAEFTKILAAAARFHEWWKDGEAKLRSRQKVGEPAQRKAA
jgi:hypothetical protein